MFQEQRTFVGFGILASLDCAHKIQTTGARGQAQWVDVGCRVVLGVHFNNCVVAVFRDCSIGVEREVVVYLVASGANRADVGCQHGRP